MTEQDIRLKESHAKSCLDWELCAGNWKEKQNNSDDSQRCLRNSEKIAVSSSDWWGLCKMWERLHNNKDESLRCLENSEILANNFRDLINCADDLSKYNIEKGVSCLRRSELHAESFYDWGKLAISWIDKFKNSIESIRCLRETEARIKNYAMPWLHCAETWKKHHDNDDDSRRCMHKAEEYASTLEWKNIAASWMITMNNESAMYRCMKKAEESCVHEFGATLSCIEAWIKFDASLQHSVQVCISLGCLLSYDFRS